MVIHHYGHFLNLPEGLIHGFHLTKLSTFIRLDNCKHLHQKKDYSQ